MGPALMMMPKSAARDLGSANLAEKRWKRKGTVKREARRMNHLDWNVCWCCLLGFVEEKRCMRGLSCVRCGGM